MPPSETSLNEVVRQALLCVRYRIAPLRVLRPVTFVHAMGLRYGLLGAAAVSYTLEESEPVEAAYAYTWAAGFRDLVVQDVEENTFRHFPITVRRRHIPMVADLAQEALLDAMPMPLMPHDPVRAASCAVDRHLRRYMALIRREWGILRAEQGLEAFVCHAVASESFARAFLERRRYGLSEVPEIALLGE